MDLALLAGNSMSSSAQIPGTITTTPPSLLHGSPVPFTSPELPQTHGITSGDPSISTETPDPGHSNSNGNSNSHKRKKSSISSQSPNKAVQSKTASGDDIKPSTKPRGNSQSGVPGLTSCEACRKGKRRCEPSPLVPLDDPNIAKLPCARCRRFALECVRVKVTRRKGPPPVDLSAISDAVHGFPHGNPNEQSSSSMTMPQMPYADTQGQQPQNTSIHGDLRRQSSGIITSPTLPIHTQSPTNSNSAYPVTVDQVVEQSLLDDIIALFFDYVYPLTPCLHKPTFMANLGAGLDRTDPVFFALVMTIIASTLVQIPRSLVRLDKVEVEALARRCVRVARSKIQYIYEDPGPVLSTYIVICYLEGIVHLLLGNNTAHVICTAQSNQLALALRLNEESSYENLDPIECEMRRRIYWLLFQADKSTACLRARTICLRLEDAANLMLPAEVDDEQITPHGIMPQPHKKTPLISGFNIATNLFRILNDALLLQRRKAPPTVDSILADLSNVNQLREKVMQTVSHVSTPLQMQGQALFELDINNNWEMELHDKFLDFFHGDQPTHAPRSFQVMQGNILVTQHLVRLVLLQARESLFHQLSLLTQMPSAGIGNFAGSHNMEAAEDIARELLDGLNSLPVECVATNGPSLVQKVRFVAIQLMECSVSPSPQTAKAQKLLMQFLSVLGVIEGMYTFGRDISAE